MASLNKLTLIGNLGKAPELRTTSTGKKVAVFTLATSERWIDSETKQNKEHTEWHDIEVWGAQAQAVKNYLDVGRQVFVEGQVRTDKWRDSETNEPRSKKKVVATRVLFLGQSPEDASPSEPDSAA